MGDTTRREPSAATGHLRGSIMLVAGRVLAIGINFFVQILTVRYLTKADYGVFAFALSVAGVLAVLGAFGMDKAVSRFLAVFLQARDYPRFWGMLTLMLLTILGLGILILSLFIPAWIMGLPLLASESSAQLVLAIIAGLAVCNAMDALFIALFAILAGPRSIFLRRHVLGPLLKLMAAVVVIVCGGGVVAFAFGQLLAGLLGIGICLSMFAGMVRRYPELRHALSQPFVYPWRQLYAYSTTLLSGDLAFLLRGAMVPLVLGLMFVSAEVASYQAVIPVARLGELVLVTFTVLFLPSAAKLAANDQHAELQSLFEKTTLWITLLSFPIFAASFLAARFLPVLLFGPEYQSSGSILAWLAVGYFANASFGTALRLLRASGKLRTLLLADVLLILIAVGLIFALVPQYGALGGAWAVCLTYVAQAILYQVLVATTTRVNPFTSRSIAPFVVGMALCAGGEVLRELLDGGLILSLSLAVVSTLLLWMIFGRALNVTGTFPEITKLPIVRRWMPVASGEARLP